MTDVEDASTGSTDTIEDDASQALAQAVTDDPALPGLSYGDSGSYGSGSGSGSYAIAAEEDADGYVMEGAAVAEKDPKMTKELAQSIQQGYIFAKKMGFNISADESAVAAKAAASKNVTPSSCEDGCNKCMAAEKDGTINCADEDTAYSEYSGSERELCFHFGKRVLECERGKLIPRRKHKEMCHSLEVTL